jgi:hypothetical protein
MENDFYGGEFYDTENASATPSISKETAFKKAINHIGFKIFMENPENALKIGYHKPEGTSFSSINDQGEKHKSKFA